MVFSHSHAAHPRPFCVVRVILWPPLGQTFFAECWPPRQEASFLDLVQRMIYARAAIPC